MNDDINVRVRCVYCGAEIQWDKNNSEWTDNNLPSGIGRLCVRNNLGHSDRARIKLEPKDPPIEDSELRHLYAELISVDEGLKVAMGQVVSDWHERWKEFGDDSPAPSAHVMKDDHGSPLLAPLLVGRAQCLAAMTQLRLAGVR
jgi:hypothetical protein